MIGQKQDMAGHEPQLEEASGLPACTDLDPALLRRLPTALSPSEGDAGVSRAVSAG